MRLLDHLGLALHELELGLHIVLGEAACALRVDPP